MTAAEQQFLDDCRSRGIEVTEGPRKPAKATKAPSVASHAQTPPEQHRRLFDLLCERNGLPKPKYEVAFAECIGRKWRADYLFSDWLIVEKEGGIWTQGAHVRGKHFESDCEKYAEAAILGYTVLRFPVEWFDDGRAFDFIRRMLATKEQSCQ